MKEIGMLNRQIDSALNRQGHMDGLMVVDAGFPCPDEVEVIAHAELKRRSREVKTIVRTGDFTAWGNVLLVSGAGPRWKMER